jgi:outer membrane protein assembly factor BamB
MEANMSDSGKSKFLSVVLLPTLLFLAGIGMADSGSDILGVSGAKGGIILVLGPADAELLRQLRPSESFIVQALLPDNSQVESVRKNLQKNKAVYGPVSVRFWNESHLPYVGDLVEGIVVTGKTNIPLTEMLRVLAPGGWGAVRNNPGSKEKLTAAGVKDLQEKNGFLFFKKPVSEDMDEWTHYLHGPDGNPMSMDRKVGPPKNLRWTSGPSWGFDHEVDTGLNALVSAQGRIFSIEDISGVRIPSSNLPGRWGLVARSGWNGAILWTRQIPEWGWQYFKKEMYTWQYSPNQLNRRLVAVGKRVFVTLGYNAPVSMLDATTGKTLRVFEQAQNVDEILVTDNILIVSSNSEPVKPQSAAEYKTARKYPPKSIQAFSLETGKRLWERTDILGSSRGNNNKKAKKSAGRGGWIGAGFVTGGPMVSVVASPAGVCYLDLNQVVCLDLETGTERWRADAEAEGEEAFTDGLAIHRDVCCVPSFYGFKVFDMKTGKQLWRKKHVSFGWMSWKDIFAANGIIWTWSDREGERDKKKVKQRYPDGLNGYDCRTGKVVKHVPLGSSFAAKHHHRCYRNKASVNYLFASRLGLETVNFKTGQFQAIRNLRGLCRYGVMPANGLLYLPPHPCKCYRDTMLRGFNAMSHEPGLPAVEPSLAPKDHPVVQGPAYPAKPDNTKSAGPGEWPIYLGNPKRSLSSSAQVSTELKVQKIIEIGQNITAPIVVGNSLWFAVPDAHQVRCLDAQTGKEAWRFTAGARIDSPPTYDQGLVVFGSSDGYVYALQADSGALAWKFRAAPGPRIIGVDGQLESIWGVHGSVLIEDDVVYFASGRNSTHDGGVMFFGLDLATGRMKYSNNVLTPDEKLENLFEKKVHQRDGIKRDIPASDELGVYFHSKRFSKDLSPSKTKGGMDIQRTNSGFLDDVFHKRNVRGMGSVKGQIYCHNESEIFNTTMLKKYLHLRGDNFYRQGSGFFFQKYKPKGNKPVWEKQIPIYPAAAAITGSHYLVAASPDVLDEKDPMINYERRGKGVLYLIDKTDGRIAKKIDLPSAVKINGIAVSSKGVYLATTRGQLLIVR